MDERVNIFMVWDRKKFSVYLGWTFGIAWVLQGISSIFANQGNPNLFRVILAVSMFAPLLGAVLAKIPLKEMGFRPRLKGNVRYIFAAVGLPILFTFLGAALYFLVFPARLDLTGKYLTAAAGMDVLEQLKAQGLTLASYMGITILSAIPGAFFNMLFAVGEEAGWRGAMQPMLNDRFGLMKGRLLGGAIWGAWHWPVMILAGYEYGKSYWGAPFTGMLAFCLFTAVCGTLLDVLYMRTRSVWFPALAHGSLNAVAAVSMMVLDPAYLDQMLLGPSLIGVISMIPMLLAALWLLWRDSKQKTA